MTKYLVAESVGKGHPDKICDQIADAILDQCLAQDRYSHVACEVMASNRLIVVGGEITTTANYNVEQAVWTVLLPLGYKKGDFTIINNIHQQSPEINAKVSKEGGLFGAGDQGITYGYATNETANYLPIQVNIANRIMQHLETLRLNAKILYLKADMKTMVELSVSDKEMTVKRIILAIQHEVFQNDILKQTWKEQIKTSVAKLIQDEFQIPCQPTHIYVNMGGDFVLGGPIADTGLTGRKLECDSYCGATAHGGGAFSGKDYTKVDRSGAYLARYVAKNVVYNKLADKCQIGFVWQIGSPTPDLVMIDCFNTNKKPIDEIRKIIYKNFWDLNINQIVWMLGLDRPIYLGTSCYGHFTNQEAPWEHTFKFEETGHAVK